MVSCVNGENVRTSLDCSRCQEAFHDDPESDEEARRVEREPLSRERVIGTALGFIDEHGLDALSMRRLAAELGVEAMSLYNHVDNKDDLLNGVVDVLIAQVDVVPADPADWKRSLLKGLHDYHGVMSRHPNAIPLLARYSGDEAQQLLLEQFIRLLAEAGFDSETIHSAWHLCGSYIFGYVLMGHAGNSRHEGRPGVFAERLRLGAFSDEFPFLREHGVQFLQCEPQREFSFGIEIILDGLEQALRAQGAARRRRRRARGR